MKKKPLAVILGKNFLGKALEKTLTERGVRVLLLGLKDDFPPKKPSPDYIFHLEGLFPKPLLFKKTEELLPWSKKGKTKFLLALPQEEGRAPLRGVGEELGALVRKKDVNWRVVFLPKIYGPGMGLSQDPLGKFMAQALEGKEIVVPGEGLKKHSYIFLEDAVRGILWVMFQDEGGPFVLSSQPVTSLELAYLVKKASRGNPKIVFAEKPEPKEVVLKAQASLKKGIRKTLKAFR